MTVEVVPVIDLKAGQAVHAIGGRRDQYRPLRSVWQAGAAPTALVAAMHRGLGVDRLYLADLDAIEGWTRDVPLYRRMAEQGLTIWLDAGVRDLASLEPLMDLDPRSFRIVVGLESVEGPGALGTIIERAGADRLIFSLDLDDGRPRRARGAIWPGDDPLEIAARVVEMGIARLILLDLTRVGTGRGIGTEDLMARIRARCEKVSLIVGGGIAGIDDVLRLGERGASAVLVGSALHDGRIGTRELERIAAAGDDPG